MSTSNDKITITHIDQGREVQTYEFSSEEIKRLHSLRSFLESPAHKLIAPPPGASMVAIILSGITALEKLQEMSK